MLSTIRTIFTFNKNLTLPLPSALTWVFLYNHEGPCGVVLCPLEMMTIKKHLLSDYYYYFFSIWLSLRLWSLSSPGYATGLPFVFFFLLHRWIPPFFCWITALRSPNYIYHYVVLAGVCLWARELMCLLDECTVLVAFCLSFPCCKLWIAIFLWSLTEWH